MARAQGLTAGSGNRGLLVVAALAGLAAAVLFIVAVNQDSGTSGGSTGADTVAKVVAAKPIPASTRIEADMVKIIEVPEDVAVADAFPNTQSVVGQVSTYKISEGEQITPTKIGAPLEGSSGGASSALPPGKRGFAISVDQTSSAGGHLLPGDRVDVIAVFPPEHPLLAQFPGAVGGLGITVLQNIEVLSVGDISQEGRGAAAADADGDGAPDTATSGQVPENVEEKPEATTVTLIVDSDQAQLLAVVQQEAKEVSASLRGIGDQEEVPLGPVDLSRLHP